MVCKYDLDSIVGKEQFYECKNIKMYRLKTGPAQYLKYWFAILLTDEDNKNKGKLIPCLDIRTLPGYEDIIKQKGIYVLEFFPDKIVFPLFVKALKRGLIQSTMCINWENEKIKKVI